MSDFHEPINVDARAAQTIAAGMRAVAGADGDHPNELALIQAFEQELPSTGPGRVDLTALTTDASKEIFLKSLVLVALADGRMSEEEVLVIQDFSRQLGLTEAVLSEMVQQVSVVMLSHFSGVTHFRDQANAIGRSLGLNDATIARVLSTGQ